MAATTTPSSSLLKNKYWIVRHGKSLANEQGIIVASMENGILPEYQLGSEGVKQAELAGEKFLKELKDANIALENVRICFSPFSRTAHTAKVIASVLNLPFDGPQCKVFEDLRERYFGPSYELASYHRYPEIWDHDEQDPFEQLEGGESVADVVSRLTNAMQEMETMYEGCAILIVSHGDPLQVLQTVLNAVKEQKESSGNFASRVAAAKVPSVLSKHRNFALETAELRAVI